MSTTSKQSQPIRHRSGLRRSGLALGAALSLAGVWLVPAHAAAPAAPVTHRLHAQLRASGDPDGSGSASFKLTKSTGKVCVTATWKHIATPNSAHIHRKSDSTIVIDLTPAVTGGAHCTTGVSHALIGRILAHPGRYYFNVHNMPYSAGAIQGTLRR